MNNKIYILSTGRTGTTFISNLFNQLDSDLEVTHQKKGSRLINILANTPFNNPKVLWFLLKVFKRRDSRNVESTADPLLSYAVYNLMKKRYIKGKVIHLVRNPESFVDSFMKWKNNSIRKRILHNLVPFWNPSPYLNDPSISFIEWLQMTKYDKFCWVWNHKNREYHSLENLSDIEYLLVRLEDLTNNDN
ncbi:MAG: sulfotransferase domain-containing protein, partial [Bacteroidales bacterium]|nr:sulfotransferase domain-containing protein [Bacteroidales bacterium]